MFLKRVYRYRVYGLNIQSEIKFNEFITIDKDSEIDVKILFGKVDKERINKERDFGFPIINVGKFAIINNEEIVIEPFRGTTKAEIRDSIVQTVMSILLYRRNCIPIHGGTIIINNKSVLIVGESGAGKTSLTTALRKKGYGFISDDLACVEVKDKPLCMPAFPYQNLCKDTAKNFGYDVKKLKVIDKKRDKYILDVNESFINSPFPLGAIFQIKKSHCKSVEMEEIKGKEKLNFILNNMFTAQITETLGLSNRFFKNCIEVANNIPCFIIYRPENLFTVNDQIRCVENIVL